MPLRILFVASLHHPEALREAIAAAPPGEPPPLFPPSMAQHHLAAALRARGHTLAVFYRNRPTLGGHRAQRHRQGLTPGKMLTALARRVPPELNPEIRLRNRRLRAQAREFRPDVLWLVGDNTVISAATLEAIRAENNCRLIYASGTSPIVFSHAMERRAAPLVDLVLVNDFYHGIQWRELGAPRVEVLPLSACNPDFHRPVDLSEAQRAAYRSDIAFVGTLVPANLYSRRVRALEALRDFNPAIWSVHEVPGSLRPHVRGAVLGAEMLRILSAAKICFNTHGDFVHYGGNLRLFEAAGVGTFQIVEDLPGVHEWFTDGETIVTYRDLDELRDKAAYYLEHENEREAIARRAREHVYAHHTYAQRAARVEALLNALP